MAAEREPALEIPLHGERVRLHEPRAVLILAAEQERDALAIRRIGRRHAGDVQRVQTTGRSRRRPAPFGKTATSRRRLPAARESP